MGRLLTVCLMLFCILLLTSANFFIYNTDTPIASVFDVDTEENCKDYPPTGPTEEKASSSVSINEEILHEAHPGFDFKAIDQLYLHHIAESEKIEMFHPERLLPPPKF